MATKGQAQAVWELARQRMPRQVYLCSRCKIMLQPGEVESDHYATWEEHGVLFHKPCRQPLVLYNRG
jgi:hypothetical protein